MTRGALLPAHPPRRDRPVPIPVPGMQLVTLTHVEDVASMLAAVPGNKAAIGQHYNVCSDRAITFQGARRVRALGAAATAHCSAPSPCLQQRSQARTQNTQHTAHNPRQPLQVPLHTAHTLSL